jgi:hypothetical protein
MLLMSCDDVRVVRWAWPRIWVETKVVLVGGPNKELRMINRVNVYTVRRV